MRADPHDLQPGVQGLLADAAGRITGSAAGNGYFCRVKEHANDVRFTATLRVIDGNEVALWLCGSPERTEREGYTLAVSTDGCKLQRKGEDVKRLANPLG